MKIRFKYGPSFYQVEESAYDLNLIVLPDGTVIQASVWYESYPPQPGGLHEVPNVFKESLEPDAIAKLLNGVLAEEIVK